MIYTKLQINIDNELLLWSLRFEPDGPLCELWLERSLTIDHQFDKKVEFLPSMISFFWSVSVSLLIDAIDRITNDTL